jgi:hypothetical protein
MDYVRLITEASHRSTPNDVQKLRDLGWREEQIAEAVYITAMFAFFNRVADAFGIPPQNYLAKPKLSDGSGREPGRFESTSKVTTTE